MENIKKDLKFSIIIILAGIFLQTGICFSQTLRIPFDKSYTRIEEILNNSSGSTIIDIMSKEKLSFEDLQRVLNDIRVAKEAGEAGVYELVGLKNGASRRDVSRALKHLIFMLHPDRISDNQLKEVANSITVILIELKESFDDAQKEVFVSDDGSLFGTVDKNDIYRLHIMRQIKEDFFERLKDAITMPHIYAQEADIRLVYDVHSHNINIWSYQSKIGEILLDENKDIAGIEFDLSLYPGLTHGTGGDSLFIERRMHLVEQVSQDPFIALFLLHQFNNFRNHFQVIPKHARKNLSFSFDVLGADYLGAKTAGRYSYRFGIFVPLDKRYSHEGISGIGTFAHEFQHLYGDTNGDSAAEALRRIKDEDLRRRTQGFHENIILTCIDPEKGEDYARYKEAGFVPESALDYPQKLNVDPRYIYHLPNVFLPLETRLALNDIDRVYKKTGKHIKTHLMEWAHKNGYWIDSLNVRYYLDPNEWLAQKAQYYLTLDIGSLFDIYCEIGMEEEFLSEEDIAYFRERYGEKAYLRYLLLRAIDRGDETAAGQLEEEMQKIDPNNTVFALPPLNEMLTFVQSDIIYHNLAALVSRLTDEDVDRQHSLTASVTEARADYFFTATPQLALTAPFDNESQIQQMIRTFIGTYTKINHLQAVARFLSSRELFMHDHDDTLFTLFWKELENTQGTGRVFINMPREKLRELLRSMNALAMIRDRIEKLESSFLEKYNITPEQVYIAIQSLPNLEVAEFTKDVANGVFAGAYPEGHQYEYLQLIEALKKQGINGYRIDNDDGLFNVIRSILQHTNSQPIIQERIKQLETKFLEDHNVTKEKVYAAIRGMSSLENVRETLNISDGIMQWGTGIRELYDMLRNQGIDVQNLSIKDIVRLLRLTDARPVIEERMCALSSDLAELENRTQAAILVLTESRGLISSGYEESRLLSPSSSSNEVGIIQQPHNAAIVSRELSESYSKQSQLLEEIRELLMYKEDPIAKDYIIRRLKIIIDEIDKILKSLDPLTEGNAVSLKHNLIAAKDNVENILGQLSPTQSDLSRDLTTNRGTQRLPKDTRNCI